jgi:hypothetical protein
MKFTYFFIGLIILLMCCLPVSASNETIIPPQRVTMTIYGDGYYINNMPLPAGTVILAKDQFKSTIGAYTIKEVGRIGKPYGNDKFEIGVWRNQSDKSNRTMPIFITFMVGGIPTKNTLDFRQNEDVNFDIITRTLPTDPTMVETRIPTLTSITTIETLPSGVRTLPTPPIVIATTRSNIIVAPEIDVPGQIQTTQVVTTQSKQTTQQTKPTESVDNSREYVYYGIIITFIIIVSILIVGVIISYLNSKTSRDEVMHPDGSWKGK